MSFILFSCVEYENCQLCLHSSRQIYLSHVIWLKSKNIPYTVKDKHPPQNLSLRDLNNQ